MPFLTVLFISWFSYNQPPISVADMTQIIHSLQSTQTLLGGLAMEGGRVGPQGYACSTSLRGEFN